MAVGIRLNQAGIDGETFATDQIFRQTTAYRFIEIVAQNVAIAKPAMMVFGKRRMVGNLAFQAKAAEPPVGQVQMNLFTQAVLRTNAKTIADDQHADHQFRINGRTARETVIIAQMLSNTGQIDKTVNETQKVIVGNMLFEVKTVKLGFLVRLTLAHHRRISTVNPNELNQDKAAISSRSFSTQLTRNRRLLGLLSKLCEQFCP